MFFKLILLSMFMLSSNSNFPLNQNIIFSLKLENNDARINKYIYRISEHEKTNKIKIKDLTILLSYILQTNTNEVKLPRALRNHYKSDLEAMTIKYKNMHTKGSELIEKMRDEKNKFLLTDEEKNDYFDGLKELINTSLDVSFKSGKFFRKENLDTIDQSIKESIKNKELIMGIEFHFENKIKESCYDMQFIFVAVKNETDVMGKNKINLMNK